MTVELNRGGDRTRGDQCTAQDPREQVPLHASFYGGGKDRDVKNRELRTRAYLGSAKGIIYNYLKNKEKIC
jgi:hypothetical protein